MTYNVFSGTLNPTQSIRHKDRHTDARDHNTFCVVYDSRKM